MSDEHPLCRPVTLLLTYVFALLTILTWLVTIALVASPTVRRTLVPHAVGAAAAITGTATLGSLYLSEVAGYVPCELCWVQRIFMYSIATVTTVGLLRRRAEALTHCVALAVIGLAISLWHVAVQRLPDVGSTCDPLNPCSAIYVERFGFITIPVMAGSAFVVVLALAWAVHRESSDISDPVPLQERVQ